MVDCPWTCSRPKVSLIFSLAKTISPGPLNRFFPYFFILLRPYFHRASQPTLAAVALRESSSPRNSFARESRPGHRNRGLLQATKFHWGQIARRRAHRLRELGKGNLSPDSDPG